MEDLIENVMVMNVEACEFRAEDARICGTVLLHCRARDNTVSVTKQLDESSVLIESDRSTPTAMHKAWTFVRFQHGKWLLSAIQQVHS